MRRAIARLGGHDHVIVDGNRIVGFEGHVGPYTNIVDGDARVYSIACASVVAKVVRDRMMALLAARYPGYGWEHNQGYATRDHRDAIRAMGLTPFHRRSFLALQRTLAGDQLDFDLLADPIASDETSTNSSSGSRSRSWPTTRCSTPTTSSSSRSAPAPDTRAGALDARVRGPPTNGQSERTHRGGPPDGRDEAAAPPFGVVGHPVPGHPGDVLDDGDPASQHPVDKRRLAHVGPPDDGEHGLPHRLPRR